MLGVPTFRC